MRDYTREDLYQDIADNIHRDSRDYPKHLFMTATIDRLRRLVKLVEDNEI